MEAPKLPATSVLLSAAGQNIAEGLHAIERAMTDGDVGAALRALNARSCLRFSAIQRFEPPVLHTLYALDREYDDLLAIPRRSTLEESYSAIVRRTAKPFFTEASEYDARLMSHPARTVTIAYAGVPLFDAEGCVVGALCHYDHRPRPIPLSEIAAMTHAAAALSQWLSFAPQPAQS
jgi:GAF domain-containing protein